MGGWVGGWEGWVGRYVGCVYGEGVGVRMGGWVGIGRYI